MQAPNKQANSLRIWHIAESYPPDYCGGAAIYLRDVCRFTAERGHDVRVLCAEACENPPYTLRTDYDGAVRIDRLNLPYFKTQDPGGWRLGVRAWRKHQQRVMQVAGEILGDWSPDLVQFHTPYSLYEECLPLIQSRSIPVVGMLHCAWLICPRLRLMQSPTNTSCSGPAPLKCLECLYSHWDGSHTRAALKLPWRILKLGVYPAYRLWLRNNARHAVSGLIGYSRFMAEAHKDRIQGPVQHIPLGVDLSGLPSRLSSPLDARPRNPLQFGFLGGIQRHKGIQDVLDAAASLQRKGMVFQLHLWGPDDHNTGPSEIENRGLGQSVFYHGLFKPEELWSVYNKIDVLIMATQDNEPFGRVIQEAAAAGVPAIAPAIAGIAEQIHSGVDGLLYQFRSVEDLERQMAAVLEQPALVSQMVTNLWPVVDTRVAVSDIEQFYFQILHLARDGGNLPGEPLRRPPVANTQPISSRDVPEEPECTNS